MRDDEERSADADGDDTGDAEGNDTADDTGDGTGDDTADDTGDDTHDAEGDFDNDRDQTDVSPPPVGPRRTSRGGTILGAAMLGLHQALYGKQETETVIEIEVSGDPPNIDLDGLDEDLDGHRRMVGPPLDQIKARRQPTRPARPARPARPTRPTRAARRTHRRH